MAQLFKVQVSLQSKYKALIQRGRPLHEQVHKSEFPERRDAGHTNLDLWLDGKIYPLDPVTKKRPSFHDLKSLLEFIGDGRSGFLGYACNLQSSCEQSDADTIERQRLQLEVQSLRGIMQNGQIQEQQLVALTRELKVLSEENSNLKSASTIALDLISSLREEISSLSQDVIDGVQSELDLEVQIEELRKSHRIELERATSEVLETKRALLKLERKWSRLHETPYGFRKQVRSRKDIASLSQSGGHAKSLRRLARAIIAPATVKQIQDDNIRYQKKQRLCGPVETQVQSGKVLASIFSKKEVSSMLQVPSLQSVGIDITNQNLERIGRGMGEHEVLGINNKNNITQEGYNALFQGFTKSARTTCRGVRISSLMPKPHHVSLLRKELNSKFKDFVGDYYSINNILEIPPKKNSKKKPAGLLRLELNEFNSLFVDIEVVQRTMISLYQITQEEIGENPLIFVIKMDEAEIVREQKFERVSITLMNRALNSNIDMKSAQYFSVQSEREIWPIGCFQVEKETHEILAWVFNQTKIPELISAQEAGQMLHVPGSGSFNVEWHLSADMKTIKCLYGLSQGACASMTCMYCCQKKTRSSITTAAQAQAAFAKKGSSWSGGLFSSAIDSKPVSHDATLERWKPILPIKLERVHMCTMHAFNRIIEKIVHLHFQFIWTIRDEVLKQDAIHEMQKVVSATGAHGGNVKIFKDDKLSGNKNSIPSKPSFNGAHVARLFKASPLHDGSNVLYKDVVNAEKNFLDNGESKRLKLDVWSGLEELRPYFTNLILTDELKSQFTEKIERWGRSYVVAFGETHVTHYIHALVRHAPYFVDTYGSLAIWSCQGMEYSHYAAKAAYQRHTQHSGGRSKKSPLVQTYNHWYRIIQHRFRDQEKLDKEAVFRDTEEGLAAEARILQRRETSISSSAQAHWELWRAKCDRVGSKYIPRVEAN